LKPLDFKTLKIVSTAQYFFMLLLLV